jgi:hypothetical protein
MELPTADEWFALDTLSQSFMDSKYAEVTVKIVAGLFYKYCPPDISDVEYDEYCNAFAGAIEQNTGILDARERLGVWVVEGMSEEDKAAFMKGMANLGKNLKE